ncbi:arabinose transporter [Chitinophaga sp. Mgbs1]|uniref:Arabinose transporter n=1 Tax=Chitinophaga solisilvae TaxID=1233460 RepID=A0A3S1B4D6_9BACT|nr:arabinose transporter [Chitinophaga solisilvae]
MTETKKFVLVADSSGDMVEDIIIQKSNTTFYQVIIPIIVAVFGVYLTIGMTLGVLPGFVQHELKSGSIAVGVVIGLQSLATLLTRAYSGKLTDTKGGKHSSHLGIWLALVTGVCYLLATWTSFNPTLALILILVSRIMHGVSESLFVTGALTWGIGLVGADKSGKVMTWNGIAMYAGIAVGAPLSIWLQHVSGIQAVFLVVILLSVCSWLATSRLPNLAADPDHIRTPFYRVIGKIAGQGLGLAFSSIGFACISSFIALLFSSKQWGNPSLAFMSFGACYILTRVFFSSFPDKFGGYRVALISLAVEIMGQLLIGFAPSKAVAIIGCSITGVGFSLIFPALGVLAISKVQPQMRGTALGAYAAFFDLSLGLAGPIAGIIAGWYNYQAVYLFGGASCLISILTLLITRKKSSWK